MKRGKGFAKVVYYLFTIMIGILMCVFLPYIFMYDGQSMNMIEESLQEGRPADAMALVGGYFKSEPILEQDLQNGGKIILFESATLHQQIYGEGESAQSKFKLHKSYTGFVYGVGGLYNTRQEQNNKTILKIKSGENEFDFDLLNSDLNNDGAMDVISTLVKNGFFLLELDQTSLTELQVTSISALKFYDKDGNLFAEVAMPDEIFGEDVFFNSQFFTDVDPTIAKYNEIIDFEVNHAEDADFNAKAQAMAQELSVLDAGLIEKGYAKSTTSIARSRADKLATITIVFYFVGIFIIGDLLVGKRHIIRFFNWLLVKVFKVDLEKIKLKRKSKKQQAETVDFGGDYYCQVTFCVDEQSRNNLDDVVKVTYASDSQTIVFTLANNNKFTDLQRVQKDVLKLTSVESQNSIKYEEIPDLLVIEGFNKSVSIKTMMQEE